MWGFMENCENFKKMSFRGLEKRLRNRKCTKEKKHQYLTLYQNWNRTRVYLELAVSASYRLFAHLFIPLFIIGRICILYSTTDPLPPTSICFWYLVMSGKVAKAFNMSYYHRTSQTLFFLWLSCQFIATQAPMPVSSICYSGLSFPV